MYSVTAQIPGCRRELPPQQHFIPPAAVWRSPVTPGDHRNQHLSWVHKRGCRELFHCPKEEAVPSLWAALSSSTRMGRGEESKGNSIQGSQCCWALCCKFTPTHSMGFWAWTTPRWCLDTFSSQGAKSEQVVTQQHKLNLMFSSAPLQQLTATSCWPSISVCGLLKSGAAKNNGLP